MFERLQQQERQLAERDTQRSVREKQLARNDEELKRKQLKIDQLAHEIATRSGSHSKGNQNGVPENSAHATESRSQWVPRTLTDHSTSLPTH